MECEFSSRGADNFYHICRGEKTCRGFFRRRWRLPRDGEGTFCSRHGEIPLAFSRGDNRYLAEPPMVERHSAILFLAALSYCGLCLMNWGVYP